MYGLYTCSIYIYSKGRQVAHGPRQPRHPAARLYHLSPWHLDLHDVGVVGVPPDPLVKVGGVGVVHPQQRDRVVRPVKDRPPVSTAEELDFIPDGRWMDGWMDGWMGVVLMEL